VRIIWNADVVVDTNVVSRASRSEGRFWVVANMLRRMTARPELGAVHFGIGSIDEWLASENEATQLQYLRTFRRLYKFLPNRLMMLGDVPSMIEGEWATPFHSRRVRAEFLDAEIAKVLDRGTIRGTVLEVARTRHLKRRADQQAAFDVERERFQKHYRTDEKFRTAIQQVLTNLGPEAFTICDDLAAQLIVAHGKRPASAVKLALKNPGRYLTTWTFALLRRLSQFAQTFPNDLRSFAGDRFLEVLKPRPSDFADAEIAASGARCGLLITEDQTLMARINLLWNAELIRLQAVDTEEAAFKFPDKPPDFASTTEELVRWQNWPVHRFAKVPKPT
jgi:hypothetical protein